jgi:hypothetical protein
MNFILNQKYSDGNTPIRPEEAEQLIPRISTMGELNEYEALNILRARTIPYSITFVISSAAGIRYGKKERSICEGKTQNPRIWLPVDRGFPPVRALQPPPHVQTRASLLIPVKRRFR